MAEDFAKAFDGALKDLTMQVISARLVGVLYEVNRVKSKYGRELIDVGIGVRSAPFFAPASSWKPLGDAWLRRKKATQDDPRFYSGLTGHLAQDILAMPTERIFGKTKLTAAANVRLDSGGFYNPRTRKFINTVYRDDRGRFASPEMDGIKRFTVRVDPFPELNSMGSGSDYINKLPISASSKMKLNYNKKARPLIVGFTEWFYQNKIKFAIEQGLKEVFK